MKSSTELISHVEPPESFRGDRFEKESTIHLMQSGDIWSYGCVLSEAAVWLGVGYEGLLNYRSGLSAADLSRKTGGDYRFHDGKRILPKIDDAHDLLSTRLRFCDGTTSIVLKMIEDHVLLEDPHSRLDAHQLVRKADALFEERKRSSISRGDLRRLYPLNKELWREGGYTVGGWGMGHPASLIHEAHMPKLISNLSGEDRTPRGSIRFGTDASIGASQTPQTPQDITLGTEEKSKGKAHLDPQVTAKTTSISKKRAVKGLPVLSINEAFEWKRAKKKKNSIFKIIMKVKEPTLEGEWPLSRVDKRDHVRLNPPPF